MNKKGPNLSYTSKILSKRFVFRKAISRSLSVKLLQPSFSNENINLKMPCQIAGATLCKSLNRACGTLLAGSLAVGVHWIANQSGEKLEPYVNGASVFLLGLY